MIIVKKTKNKPLAKMLSDVAPAANVNVFCTNGILNS